MQTTMKWSPKRKAGIVFNKSSSKIDTKALKDMHCLTYQQTCINHTGVLR